MVYKKEPYRELDRLWEDYESNIESIKKYLDDIYYDGFGKNCYYSSELLDDRPHLRITYEIEYSYLLKMRGIDPPYYLRLDINPLEVTLFLLPKEIQFLSTAELLSPLSPPSFPLPKVHPLFRLPKAKYPDWYLQYVPRDVKNRKNLVDEMENLKIAIKQKEAEFSASYQTLHKELESLKKLLSEQDIQANERLIEIAHLRHFLPKFLRTPFKININSTNKIALMEFEFPDYSDVVIVTDFKETRRGTVPQLASETLKKKLIKQCLYSLIIRNAYLVSKYVCEGLFESVAINVTQKWFDPSTGQPREGTIASLHAPVNYLSGLDLNKLDPEMCFKHLKGIMTPSLQNAGPIRPIFVLNKNDERLVETKDVDSLLDPEFNLAAMEWEDFEHLVAQLFELEFSKNGIEVKVTRASRDRGVDALLFDPDPIKGGKYVLQAKRYTRTVDVSAVRDLYGTVVNEGANRGILITTSTYGPDAYEFSKDKPISLVDGSHLLSMLHKHGKKFRIDLEEARQLVKG